jgi:hypothetical protein
MWGVLVSPDTSVRTSPLEERLATRRILGRHLALTLALASAAVLASTAADRAVTSLIVGGALAVCIFAIAFAVANGAVRDAAVDAISRGRLHEVAQLVPEQVESLTGPTRRKGLADVLARPLLPSPGLRADVFAHARALARKDAALRAQIERVVRLLEQGRLSPVGIALAYQLVTEAGSPLYTGAPDDLARRLGRIAYLRADEPASELHALAA